MLKVLLVASLLGLFVIAACGDESGPRTRLVLEPVEGLLVEDMDAELDEAVRIIERRLDEFGLGDSKVERLGDDGIVVLVKPADAEDAERALGRTGLLQLCEPVINKDGDVAIVQNGTVSYEPGTCKPERDEAGEIVLIPVFVDPAIEPRIEFVPWARQGMPAAASNPRDSDIVWQPATGLIDSEEIALDSTHLRPNTFVSTIGAVIQQPTLFFEFEDDGADVLEQVTERLSERNYPIAMFIDGEPLLDTNGLIIAPQVQVTLTGGQGTITSLAEETAEELSMLLNGGAFPIPLRIVEISEVLD